jgi:hypothetical protein
MDSDAQWLLAVQRNKRTILLALSVIVWIAFIVYVGVYMFDTRSQKPYRAPKHGASRRISRAIDARLARIPTSSHRAFLQDLEALLDDLVEEYANEE